MDGEEGTWRERVGGKAIGTATVFVFFSLLLFLFFSSLLSLALEFSFLASPLSLSP